MARKRQSLQRLAVKATARTATRRAIQDKVGNGILGTLLKSATLFTIRKLDGRV